MTLTSNTQGFAALTSVLVIGAVVTLIGLTVALTSISEGQMSLADALGTTSLDIVNGCAQIALLQLNSANTLPSSITVPAGTCTVTTESTVGTTWTFTVSGTFSGYTKTVRIVAVRSSSVSITSWVETI